MTIDLLLEVGHATVADLDCVTVEDFVEHMIFQELFVEDFKERSSNVGSHVLAKRWVIPNDVSVAVYIYIYIFQVVWSTKGMTRLFYY